MKRKVNKIGQSTLMVSLPHKWVKEYNIEKGDEVDVEIEGPTVRLSKVSTKRSEKKSCTVQIDHNYQTTLRSLLNGLYRQGYDTIHFTFSKQGTEKLIRAFVRDYLLGFEIISQGQGKCIIESWTEPDTQKAAALLRKVFFITQESYDIVLEDMSEGSKDRLETIEEFTVNGDRLLNFYSRTLFKSKELDPFIWEKISKLKHTQHGLLHLYRAYSTSPQSVSKDVLEYLTACKTLFFLVQEIYFKKKKENLEKIPMLRNKLLFVELQKIQKSKSGIFFAPYLFNLVQMTYLAWNPVLCIQEEQNKETLCV